MDPLNRFLRTVEKFAMVSRGDRVVVAVSGGPDSVALLDLFMRARRRLDLQVSVAHLNHRLRHRDSDADEAFVRSLARRQGLSVQVRRLRPGALGGPGSLEEKAREARYRFLDRVRTRTGADRVAVGHTRNDQAETFLLRLLRGSGRLGLGSIFPVRDGWLVRPLIETTRGEILAYLRSRDIPYRDDRSNRDRRFLRNRIRLDLLPVLETFNPEIITVLAATADRLRDEDRLLEDLVETRPAVPGTRTAPGLDLEVMRGRPDAIRRRMVLAALRRFLGAGHHPGSRHVDAILDLADRESSGRMTVLPGAMRAVRRPGRIDFLPPGGRPGVRSYRRRLAIPGRCRLPWAGLALTCRIVPRRRFREDLRDGGAMRAYLDAERVRPPLLVRTRRSGDRFHPFGAPGVKKLQDFFVDRKIAAELRPAWPLVTSGDDILWVVGCQIDHRYRVRRSTRHVLILAQESD